MIDKLKFDCKYFRGDIPCRPNKLRDKVCDTCDEYTPYEKKILIIKLGAMGDVIRTTPLLVKFRELYPDSHITWVTQTPDILPEKEIQEIIKFEFKEIYKIQRKSYDIAINLDKDEEACMLLTEIAAKEKYGFTWKNNHIDIATPNAEHKLITGLFDNISKQNRKNYIEEIFEICHMEFNKEPYLLNYDKDLAEKFSYLRKKAGDKIIIGLNTGCGTRWLTRLWPNEYWIQLIKDLEERNYYPVLLGGPAEDKQNIYLAEQSGAYYPGYFPLQEFIALTSQCDMIISLVTMMMHIAIGLKKPLVLFNNIFNRYEYELYDNGIIIEPPTGCDCYYGNSCTRERHCMKDLKPESVLQAVENLRAEKLSK
ncbi:MAG: glycosyltransferase family 9 protein [bacterium]